MSKSLTRQLSASFLNLLLNEGYQAEIEELDLVRNAPPFMTPEWIAGAFSNTQLTAEQAEALSASDRYIKQVQKADLMVMGAPMYNYGMPAVLKAWFDQIARLDKTFSFDLSRGNFPIEPVLNGKKLIVLSSSGEFDFTKGGIRESFNHLVPHIKSCAHYLGVDTTHDFYQISIEYQEFKDHRHEASKKAAFDALPLLLKQVLHREN